MVQVEEAEELGLTEENIREAYSDYIVKMFDVIFGLTVDEEDKKKIFKFLVGLENQWEKIQKSPKKLAQFHQRKKLPLQECSYTKFLFEEGLLGEKPPLRTQWRAKMDPMKFSSIQNWDFEE